MKYRWKEKKKLEKIQKRYVKWSLNSCIPDCIVYKETGTEKISSTSDCRILEFEEKALRDGERKLVIECIKEKEKEGNNRIEHEDRELFLR